jgi:hypothetical protein
MVLRIGGYRFYFFSREEPRFRLLKENEPTTNTTGFSAPRNVLNTCAG